MSADATTDGGDAYEEFERLVRRHTDLTMAQWQLNWDQHVVMPEGGTPARSQQLSTLSSLAHEILAGEEMADHLAALAEADLDAEQRAVVREARRQHERASAVPTELIEEITATISQAHPVWKEAKANADFETFAPTLERLVELRREEAAHIDPDRDPYEVLFEKYEPYLGIDTAERVLGRLRDGLVPLIEEIRESEADLATDAFSGRFDAETQEALSRDALDLVGYDWNRGRLDTAPHPFSSGTQFDARVTTRFDEEDPLGALTSTIHEFGHASYTLGLPDEQYGTPLGSARDMSVHESQSRLWENHVGRSVPFWELFLPKLQERFSGLSDVSVADAYEAANQVYEDNLIRTEADELTYHLHIVIRFEIERDLIRGELDVEDVPETWNDRYEQYLGIRPENDAEGCLQDIHWSNGSFGYFPTYSLGSVMAAQLYAAAEDEIDGLEDKIRNGEFGPLREWLTENVHQHGQRFTTDDLVREATGEAYTADYFLRYVDRKYRPLYAL